MTPVATTPVAGGNAAIQALDRARRALLRWALGVPSIASIVRNRDRRLLWQSTIGVVALAMATMLAPGMVFVLGPMLFGVVHVASDVRHLVLRRDVTRAMVWLVAAASVCLIALRVTELIAPNFMEFARVEIVVAGAFVVTAVIVGAYVGGSGLRAVAVMAPIAGLVALGLRSPAMSRLVFSYAHNVIAIALWVVLFRRRRAYALPRALDRRCVRRSLRDGRDALVHAARRRLGRTPHRRIDARARSVGFTARRDRTGPQLRLLASGPLLGVGGVDSTRRRARRGDHELRDDGARASS